MCVELFITDGGKLLFLMQINNRKLFVNARKYFRNAINYVPIWAD